MKYRKIGFYPYEDIKGKTSNQYIHNVEKVLARSGKIYPFYHTDEKINNLFKYDTIFLNWYENELTNRDRICLVLARMLGKKVVWTFHNRVAHDSKNSISDRKKIRFMMLVSSTIIILSKSSAPYVYELAGKKHSIRRKIVYVPHINYCENYSPRKETIVGKNKTDDFVFIYFGQIRPYKNLEILIKAFQRMNEEHCKLIIAGKPVDAVYARKIKALCGDNSHIVLDFRFIADQEMYEYLSQGDVVVLPYDKKSSMNSGAMIAAFSCKKPVIVPDIAMARDYQDCAYVYRYRYHTVEQHEKQIKKTMEKAYLQGKKVNRDIGEQAYRDVQMQNGENYVAKCIQMIWKKRKA